MEKAIFKKDSNLNTLILEILFEIDEILKVKPLDLLKDKK